MCDEGTPSERDREACREVYGYALDNRKRRYDFLEELYKSGHTQEATLLYVYATLTSSPGWAGLKSKGANSALLTC